MRSFRNSYFNLLNSIEYINNITDVFVISLNKHLIHNIQYTNNFNNLKKYKKQIKKCKKWEQVPVANPMAVCSQPYLVNQ